MLSSLLFGIVFLIGFACLVLAAVARRNQRVPATLGFVAAGLVLAIWAGRELHVRYFASEIEQRMLATEHHRDAVVRQLRAIEGKAAELGEQRDDLLAELRKTLGKGGSLEESMARCPEAQHSVEQIALLNRWLADCDRAVQHLQEMERNLETTLFYLRNTALMEGIEDTGVQDAEVSVALDHLKNVAETPAGGTVPVPLTEREMVQISEQLGVGK